MRADSVAWRYTREGMEIIHRCANEAAGPSQDPELTRQLYIDGVAYFLRGLPTDLTPEERIRIGVALPPEIMLHPRPHSPETIGSDTSEDAAVPATPTIRLTAVRPIAARITVFVVLLLKLLLYYLGLVLRQLYAYDRTYHISDRAIMRSAILLDWAWKWTASLVNKVCSMNGGQIGRFAEELTRCLAEEVSNGLFDGLREVLNKDENRARDEIDRVDASNSSSS
jgi:hypothetical protein